MPRKGMMDANKTIYIVARNLDEYSGCAQLEEITKSAGMPSVESGNLEINRAFTTLERAQFYHQSFDGKPAFGDGSGNMMHDLSIFKVLSDE